MKNTLMFLLASLLLAFSLTACGGGSQTNGDAGSYDSAGQAGGTDGAVNGNDGYNGGSDGYSGSDDGYDGGVMEDARDAMDDAGRSVRNAVDDAGDAIDRAF